MFINLCGSRKKAKNWIATMTFVMKLPCMVVKSLVYINKKKVPGHVPIGCSTLVDNFSNADKESKLTAVINGKRKREVGLVVPAEFTGRTKKRNVATILDRELEKKKERYSGHFELSSVEYNGKMYPSILQ